MKGILIYTGDDNQSHLADIDIPMKENADGWGSFSSRIPSKGVIFREKPYGEVAEFHNSPTPQFVILLQGVCEISCGDGSSRQAQAGDIIVAADTIGQGHRTRDIVGPRRTIIVPLDPNVDYNTWRVEAPENA